MLKLITIPANSQRGWHGLLLQAEREKVSGTFFLTKDKSSHVYGNGSAYFIEARAMPTLQEGLLETPLFMNDIIVSRYPSNQVFSFDTAWNDDFMTNGNYSLYIGYNDEHEYGIWSEHNVTSFSIY